MKRFFFLLIVSSLFFSNCKEFEFEGPKNVNPDPTETKVTLNFSSSNDGEKSFKVISGETLTGDSQYYFSFWLSPSKDDSIALGIWIVKDSSNNVIYQSSVVENGIDIKFPRNGKYYIEVSGSQPSNFIFNNIKIVVGKTTTPPPPPATATSPVRLYNLKLKDDGNATVDVVISKAEHQAFSNSNWFYVRRIDNTNWSTNNAVVSETDSVRFTLTFSNSDNSYIEFNTAYHDGSTGGIWLKPSIGNPPSILYSGAENTPYGGSGSFFGFRVKRISSTQMELRTYSGILLLSVGGSTPAPIPGNNGDGLADNFQIRWSGYTHFFKTVATNPTFRYKIGPTGTWTFLTATQLTSNSSYFQVEIPTGTSGQLRFQFGTGTGTNFVPASSEMNNSMYWESSTGELVKNI